MGEFVINVISYEIWLIQIKILQSYPLLSEFAEGVSRSQGPEFFHPLRTFMRPSDDPT